MFAQPLRSDEVRPAPRAQLRLVASRSAEANTPAGTASQTLPAQTIIGHRLAGGYMSVHAPGQPCGLCEGSGPLPPKPVRDDRIALYRRPE